MTGSPVTSFIAGAINKGIRDFDADLAYEAMLDAQSLGGLFDKAPYEYATWGEAKGGARAYLEHGLRPVRPRPRVALARRGRDARVRVPGLDAGAARAAAGQARDQRRAVRDGHGVLGRRGAGDRRAAGALARRRALGRRPTPRRGSGSAWEAPQQLTRVVGHRSRDAALQRRDVAERRGGHDRRSQARELGAVRGPRAGRHRGLRRPRRRQLPDRALAQLAQPVRPVDGLHPPEGLGRQVAGAVRPAGRDRLRRGQRLAGDVVHLAGRDGAGEPDGRAQGVRRQAQPRVRALRARRLHRRRARTGSRTRTSATATSPGCRSRTCSTTSGTRGCRSTGCGG